MAYKDKVVSNPVTGQQIRFLQTSNDTEGSLLEMESCYAPHSVESMPHYHPKQHETFTVLEGSIQVRLNGKVTTLHTGEQLQIPANTIHSVWNAAAAKATINWKVQPALSTEYFLETAMGLAAEGKVNAEGLLSMLQTSLLVRYYQNVFRLTKPSFALQKILFGALAPLAKLAGYKAVYDKYID